jgi:hypothetical protein
MKQHLSRRITLIAAGVALVASLAACSSHYGYPHYGGYNYGDGYRSDRQTYDAGYRRGYDHGASDRRYGYRYCYDDDDLFRRGISRDSYVNNEFRQAYVRGYQAGYYGERHW